MVSCTKKENKITFYEITQLLEKYKTLVKYKLFNKRI